MYACLEYCVFLSHHNVHVRFPKSSQIPNQNTMSIPSLSPVLSYLVPAYTAVREHFKVFTKNIVSVLNIADASYLLVSKTEKCIIKR